MHGERVEVPAGNREESWQVQSFGFDQDSEKTYDISVLERTETRYILVAI
jgi:hypothetical protein